MKKNYIMPCNKVCNIDVTESILGLSNGDGSDAVDPNTNATLGPDGNGSQENGADNLANGERGWAWGW